MDEIDHENEVFFGSCVDTCLGNCCGWTPVSEAWERVSLVIVRWIFEARDACLSGDGMTST